MKKIISLLLFVFMLFTSFNYVSADNASMVKNVMSNFYTKLDNTYSDIDKRINKLETISNKINSIRSTKGNSLSNNSKQLLNLMEISINNKLKYYKRELEKQKEEINIQDLLGEDELDYYNNNKDKDDPYKDHEDYYLNTSKGWLYLTMSDNTVTNKGFRGGDDAEINIYSGRAEDVAEIDFRGKNEDIHVKTIKVTFNKNISNFTKIPPTLDIYEGEGKTGANYMGTANQRREGNVIYYIFNNEDLIIKKGVDYKMYINASYGGKYAKGIKVEKVNVTSATGLKSGKEIKVDVNDVGYNNRLRKFNLYK